MEDNELKLIRQKRMEELQKNRGGPSGGDPQINPEELAKRKAESDLMKNTILSQALDQNAFGRLSNLQLAKPEKAKQVEDIIIRNARTGYLHGKMTDEQFRQLLNQISEMTSKKTTTVKFDRRKAAIDSDSD